MAKVTGFFTGVRGKVGTTIFQVIKGVQIMKTFAIPENPGSSGQVAQRGVFSDIVSTFKLIAKNVISIFWAPTTSGNQTAWGNFISKNLISMGKVAFDLTDGILCFGSLESISTLSATYDTVTGAFAITFSDDEEVNGSADDDVSFIVVDSSDNLVVGKLLQEETRDSGTATPSISVGLTATDLELFAFCSQTGFVATGAGLVSNSTHCTCTAPV